MKARREYYRVIYAYLPDGHVGFIGHEKTFEGAKSEAEGLNAKYGPGHRVMRCVEQEVQ